MAAAATCVHLRTRPYTPRTNGKASASFIRLVSLAYPERRRPHGSLEPPARQPCLTPRRSRQLA